MLIHLWSIVLSPYFVANKANTNSAIFCSSYHSTGSFLARYTRGIHSLDDVNRDIETQLRNHEPVTGPMMDPNRPIRVDWTTPKVRIVILLPRGEEKAFLESRKKYRAWIDEMYWKKVASTDAPSSARPGTERPSKWYFEARRALCPDSDGWASPYTMEWAEAREAADDMDSYPEGTWNGYY